MEATSAPPSRARAAQVAPTDGTAVLMRRPSRASKGASEAASGGKPAPPPAAAPEDAASQAHFRSAGRAALAGYAAFYLRMLAAVAVITAAVGGIFAALSWAVPNRLCYDYARALSGSSLGLKGCAYVADGRYDRPEPLFWLAFWAVQSAWVPLFPGVICRVLFGAAMSRAQVAATAAATLGCGAVPVVTGLVYGMPLNNPYVLLTSTLGSLTVNIVCGSAAARATGDPLTKARWVLLFLSAGAVNSIYLFAVPSMITSRASDVLGGMALAVVRVVVHPAVWAAVLLYFRVFMRHVGRVPDLGHAAFLVWPVMYAALYGRFLLLQLDSVGSVVVMNLLFACLKVAVELPGRGTDGWFLGAMYGARASEAMQATPAVDAEELVRMLIDTSMEAASIVGAAALLAVGKVAKSPGAAPDLRPIWVDAGVQLATTVVFNFVEVVAYGKFHNLEWRKAWPKRIGRLLSLILLVLAFGASRYVLLAA
jgi:hypothetical protein